MIADDEVLKALSGKNVLIDAILLEVNVQRSEDFSLVGLKFRARQGSDYSEIFLEFREVVEAGIYFSKDSIPFDVWDLKFIRTEGGEFYITLDPDPSTLGSAGADPVIPSDTDEFFVLASHVSATLVRA